MKYKYTLVMIDDSMASFLYVLIVTDGQVIRAGVSVT